MIIQGTWSLSLLHRLSSRKGCAGRVTHRGLYFACHINGETALPIQYAESMIALTVTRFVWPAVTLESQDRDKTNPVVPIPKHIRNQEISEFMGG